MGKIKILHIIHGEETSPGIFAVARQIKTLCNLDELENHSFYLRNRTSFFPVLAEIRRLKKMICEVKPDIIHAHHGTMTSFVGVLAKGRIPLVVGLKGTDLNPATGISKIRAFMGRVLTHISALFAVKLLPVCRRLEEKLIWGKEKSEIVTDGVNTDLFRPLDRKECIEKLSLDENIKYILFNAGNGRHIKRLEIAQKAVEIVSQKMPFAKLLILSGKIEPDTVPLYINACDVLLLTSDSEGSPNVVREAMACNLPVVSTDVGDVKERLEGVYPSAIVSQNPYEIAEVLQKIISLDTRSDGRRKTADFSDDAILKKLLKIYRCTAKKNDR